jgi:predicted Ser/Thr protein kinase
MSVTNMTMGQRIDRINKKWKENPVNKFSQQDEKSFSWESSRVRQEYTVAEDQPEQGSNSGVLKCVNRATNQPIILKALKVYGDNPLERFVKEIAYQQLAAELGFAPQVLHYGLGNIIFGLPAWEFLGKDMLFIMMEYKGQSLSKYLTQDPPLYDDQAYQLLARIQSIYSEMLAQGLSTQDLTAENIVVDSAGHITVIDFDPGQCDDITTYTRPSDRPALADIIDRDEGLNEDSTLVEIMGVQYPSQFECIYNLIFQGRHFPHRCGECHYVYDGNAQCRHPWGLPGDEDSSDEDSSDEDSNAGNDQDYSNMRLTELKAMAKDAGFKPDQLRVYGRLTMKKTYIDALSSGGVTVPPEPSYHQFSSIASYHRFV